MWGGEEGLGSFPLNLEEKELIFAQLCHQLAVQSCTHSSRPHRGPQFPLLPDEKTSPRIKSCQPRMHGAAFNLLMEKGSLCLMFQKNVLWFVLAKEVHFKAQGRPEQFPAILTKKNSDCTGETGQARLTRGTEVATASNGTDAMHHAPPQTVL